MERVLKRRDHVVMKCAQTSTACVSDPATARSALKNQPHGWEKALSETPYVTAVVNNEKYSFCT